MFERRAISNVALTKDKEVAICRVLIPASLKQEADVSAKCMIAVKKHITISGVIYII